VVSLEINGKNCEVHSAPEVALPWTTREHLRSTGAQSGPGMGWFAACTVHLDGKARMAGQDGFILELRISGKGRRKGGDL